MTTTATTNHETDVHVSPEALFDSIRGTRDALSVGRAFGAPIELDGTTVIPVARVAGGGGGGGGEGTGDDESGRGFGTGFGLGAQPIGVFELHDGTTTWKPAIDVNRLLKSTQVLIGILAVCTTLVLLRRPR